MDFLATRVTQPSSFTSIDAYAGYRVAPQRAALRGYDLGNDRYAIYGGYPMPGRTVRAGTASRVSASSGSRRCGAARASRGRGEPACRRHAARTARRRRRARASRFGKRPRDDRVAIASSPRCIAATVGAALALAGALLQGMLRNPLVDPYLTGVSAGAAAAIALAILAGVAAPVLPLLGFAAGTWNGVARRGARPRVEAASTPIV